MRRLLIAALLLVASSVGAGELPLQLAIFGSNAVDFATMRAGRADGLREWNPLLGQSLGQELTVKAAFTAAEMLGVHALWRHGHKKEAVVTTLGLVAINGVAAGLNVRRARR